MNLRNISNDELITRMQKLVRTERKVMHLVLVHIAEFDSRKLYADLGFDGMYAYLTKGLGYSESAAYRRLQSARLLKQVPIVAEKIENGSLNLSQLTQVQKCLKENHKNGESFSVDQTVELLAKLENKNSFETQKTLAVELNVPVVFHEKVKPQQDDSVRVELTLTKEQFADLEQAKSLLSHICPEGGFSEVIAILAKKFNQLKLTGRKSTQTALASQDSASMSKSKNENKTNYDFEDKAKSKSRTKTEFVNKETITIAKTKAQKANVRVAGKSKRVSRQYLSIKTKRMLLEKAGHCCEYQDHKTQQKCGSRYKLEVDHVHPVAFGGTNEFANLRVLCQAHNALAARRLGIQKKLY